MEERDKQAFGADKVFAAGNVVCVVPSVSWCNLENAGLYLRPFPREETEVVYPHPAPPAVDDAYEVDLDTEGE